MRDSLEGLRNREWLSNILEWPFNVLGRLFKVSGRINPTPLRVAVLMVALNGVIDLPLALALYSGILLPSAKGKGPAITPSDWLYELLVHPVLLGYFYWLQKAGKQLFAELARRKIIESEEHLQKKLTRCHEYLQNRWIPRICAALSLLFTSWFILAFAPSLALSPYSIAPYQSWITAHPAIVLARAPVTFVTFYALLMVVYDLVIIIYTLNTLLIDQKIRVEPFSPDKAGGLSFIGRFSANLGYLIGVLGLLLSVRAMQAPASFSDMRNYVFIFGFTMYLLLVPMIFFSPLWTTHTAMVTYRDHLLAEVAAKLDSILAQLRAPNRESADQVKVLLNDFQQLDEVRTLIVNQVPVWPFNTASLRKFFSLTLSPLMPTVISVIINQVKGLVEGFIS